MKKTKKNKKHPHLFDVIDSPFVSLSYVYGRVYSLEFESKKDAVVSLEGGSVDGKCFPIAVIDCSIQKMVWHNEFLGEKECKREVDKFISHYRL